MQSKKHFEFTHTHQVTKIVELEPKKVTIGEYFFSGEAEDAITYSIERIDFKRCEFGNWNVEPSELLTIEKIEVLIEQHIYGMFPNCFESEDFHGDQYPKTRLAS